MDDVLDKERKKKKKRKKEKERIQNSDFVDCIILQRWTLFRSRSHQSKETTKEKEKKKKKKERIKK